MQIHLEPRGHRTHVRVEYQRTALRPDASALVQQLSAQDRAAGPEWEHQIASALARAH